MSEFESVRYYRAFSKELGKYITDNKKGLIDSVLKDRTRRVTVLLEDTAKPHNASAVIRSCDCFGVQDIHLIENSSNYSINPNVTKGAAYWTNLHRWEEENANNTKACFDALKAQGYKIYATSPHKNGIPVQKVDINEKIAFAFGNELHGLSETAMQEADGFVTLPMFGFTESYNISVTAAICLHEVICRLHNSELDWRISEEEKVAIRLDWYKQLVKNVELHEKTFLKKWNKK